MRIYDDLSSALSALIRDLHATRARLAAIREQLAADRDEFRGRLGATQHPAVLRAEYEATSAIRQVDEADQHVQAAIAAARVQAAQLHVDVGGSLGSVPGDATREVDPRATDGAEASHLGRFDPQPYLDEMPVFVREGRTRPKTHGRWRDRHGATHRLLSGYDGHYSPLIDQRAIRLGLIPNGAKLLTSGDVEMKFAMARRETWARTGVVTRETIVINNPKGPCSGKLSCDGLLNRYLPPGGELTVCWPGGNHKTYRGVPDQ
ncbi:MAG: hypothetical protein HKP61_17120 [Dactylosporangium sp.]|nr:hypothetical protein [Dactylosporangium sp.]NNJ62628.1 hypothetical protein [Dactylosporangium sp.]